MAGKPLAKDYRYPSRFAFSSSWGRRSRQGQNPVQGAWATIRREVKRYELFPPFSITFRNRLTSRAVGIEGWAPARVTVRAATAEANRTASGGSAPFINETARPALKASPAAVESTAWTLKAGTKDSPLPDAQ